MGSSCRMNPETAHHNRTEVHRCEYCRFPLRVSRKGRCKECGAQQDRGSLRGANLGTSGPASVESAQPGNNCGPRPPISPLSSFTTFVEATGASGTMGVEDGIGQRRRATQSYIRANSDAFMPSLSDGELDRAYERIVRSRARQGIIWPTHTG